MKTITAIICMLISMFSTFKKPATISDVCRTQLYAMGGALRFRGKRR